MNHSTTHQDPSRQDPHDKHRPLSGVRIVITGGSAGLGLGLARQAAAAGAKVVAIARGRERLEQALQGSGVHPLVADVSDKYAIHRISAEVLERLGGVDVLIHNASSLGSVPLKTLLDTECEEVEQALQTNVLGPFRLTRALLGHTLAHGHRAVVVHLSSDAAVHAYPGWGAYSLSKAALDHMTRIWAAELGDRGVRFVAVDPGDMATDLHFAALPDADPSALRDPDVVASELMAFIARLSRDPQQLPSSTVRLSAEAWRSADIWRDNP
ncbi:MAG: SDR family oxidoreductase [Myxococcota bacterium]